MCVNGKAQSPINILTAKVVLNKNLKPLIRSYDPTNVTLVNNKFNVGVRYPGNSGALIVDNKMYTLKQMHWHAPSEHRIDGQQFAAELHLVHIADDGSVSVVAILFKYGQPDPLLAKIQNKLNELAYEVRTISRGQVEALQAPLDMRCKKNARPCQPMNGRHVELYDEDIIAQGGHFPKD
ncbi:hypothetical protein DH2020_039842 [Rehmannia glutinosa]|uniref:Carbonic anhydrase n=1 Tax=Rehmannia glutinosa TaxID=99300 RepID=A0ABR0UUR6_REHGL